MARDVDTVALHATFDLVLRALAQPGAAAGPGAAGGAAPMPSRRAGPPRATPPDALVAAFERLKTSARDMATRDPVDSVASVVGAGTLLFYLAEKGKNPKCADIWDALTFITTSLSVGYDDCFAKTPAGKAIASFVMTVGPALTARLLDPPRAEAGREVADAAAHQRAVVDRLDAILDALRTASPVPPRA